MQGLVFGFWSLVSATVFSDALKDEGRKTKGQRPKTWMFSNG
jgi:hypothetical protein